MIPRTPDVLNNIENVAVGKNKNTPDFKTMYSCIAEIIDPSKKETTMDSLSLDSPRFTPEELDPLSGSDDDDFNAFGKEAFEQMEISKMSTNDQVLLNALIRNLADNLEDCMFDCKKSLPIFTEDTTSNVVCF